MPFRSRASPSAGAPPRPAAGFPSVAAATGGAPRRWCWRQSAGSAARNDTTEILVTVEGHHGTADRDVTRALADLEALLVAHARPATLNNAVRGPRDSEFAEAT